jgi:hypothetical protein
MHRRDLRRLLGGDFIDKDAFPYSYRGITIAGIGALLGLHEMKKGEARWTTKSLLSLKLNAGWLCSPVGVQQT